ncbi:TlpA family protein disulfide reductase [Tautonia plasticadhaerens]|uniref:Thiol-disulfide oxidoreductase ResA n=1 Tax=Tautonia plasticadhaerens TaxID=2527974 RepID=A0A518H7I9_9BACT|nr:TlpA disulfide reductase family protein [Tautonia plasticadhaerens]QDV36794.1 Thiol-disulfide oxidoreductase ResA [Tautonia plasticadhaerens]
MADHTHPEPNTPAGSPPSGLPGFLGRSTPDPTLPPPSEGASMGVRALLMALAVLVVGFFLYREIAVDAGEATGGSAASFDWKVVAPDGTPVNLEDYKGRPVLLNVWATWCGPCMMEMPSLIALADRPELKEADVAVLLVSTDGDLQPVQQFLSRTPTGNAEVLVAAEMPPKVFSTTGIPATFLISPDGTIVRREVGAMDWNTPEVVEELVGLADRG